MTSQRTGRPRESSATPLSVRWCAADRAAGGQYATQRRDYRTLASDLYLPDLLLQASTWNKLQSFVFLSPCCCTFLTDVLQQVLVSVLILRLLLGARMISMSSTALCCQFGAFFKNIPWWHLWAAPLIVQRSMFREQYTYNVGDFFSGPCRKGRAYEFAAFVPCLVPNANLWTREIRPFGTKVRQI